jgi:hypothetical protein
MTCEQLGWTQVALDELLLERAVLLELTIWKAAACRCRHTLSPCHDPRRPITHRMNHGEEILHTPTEAAMTMMRMRDIDDDQWKHQVRITSGAEIIIPSVISFLEDEAVNRLLTQLQQQKAPTCIGITLNRRIKNPAP